ncbi:MAG: hypothetical protein Unbinned4336contig1000_33 [Prokaryotic dsDNA virus sp.]|nr:MAG: hypothetical protein Unbinned4336contig1000_33 [Prokaryotic dsDNA virus sp.]|tara:strand:- start:19394 stop:20251 length:858 start_codon:yes stop_codon:yes gene_type:complete
MDFSKLGQAAAAAEDMTKNKSFERELPRAGVALLRFRDYIELGRHESKNPAHKPALKAMLVFELNHPDHMIEIDGKKVPSIITIRTNKGSTSKSGFKKLFNVMNKACGGDKQHFVQMIGMPFLGEIYHNTVGEGDKKQTYANLDSEGAWSLRAPVQVDALTNSQTEIPVRELDGTPKVFLWESPGIEDDDIKAMWESIYIEGEREVEDAKTKEKKTISKNWIQETIMKNLEWEGSTTQALTEEHVNLDEEGEEGSEGTQEQNLSAMSDSASAEPASEDGDDDLDY